MRMRGPEYDVEIATNSLGLRDDEPVAKVGPRVLLLGDSFAMGYGVERGELFADLLEKRLHADVINAGTGGYEIVQQVRALAEYVPVFKPDLVVYALYLGNDLAQNDEWEVRPDGTLHNKVREYPVRQPKEWKLWRLLRDAVYGVRKGRSEKEGEWLPFEGYLGLCERTLGEEARRDYAEADTLLGQMSDKAKQLGVPLVVLMLPYRSMVEPEALASLATKVPDLEARYDLGRPAREVQAKLKARGIASLDLTPSLLEEFRGEGVPLFFPIDGHLTPAGHAAVATAAGPFVSQRIPSSDAHL